MQTEITNKISIICRVDKVISNDEKFGNSVYAVTRINGAKYRILGNPEYIQEDNIIETTGYWKKEDEYGWLFETEDVKIVTGDTFDLYYERIEALADFLEESEGADFRNELKEADFEGDVEEKSIDEMVEYIIKKTDYFIYHQCRECGSDLHTILDEIIEFTEDYLEGGFDNPDESIEVMTRVCNIVIKNYYSENWRLSDR